MADENLHYQIDPVLAPVVVQAFTRYLEGATIKEITKELNAKGVRSKRGKEISENTVSLMLNNRKYIGSTDSEMLLFLTAFRRLFRRICLSCTGTYGGK